MKIMILAEIPNADHIAHAIIIAARYEEVDPERTLTKGNRARYMALRLLMRVFPHASKAFLARSVGYIGKMIHVVGTPSYQKTQKYFDKDCDKLLIRYQEKLQNRARTENKDSGTDDKTLADCVARFPDNAINFKKIPEVRASKDIPSNRPAIKLQGSVQVSAPMLNPKRSKLEEELRKAVLNTGGRLLDKDV